MSFKKYYLSILITSLVWGESLAQEPQTYEWYLNKDTASELSASNNSTLEINSPWVSISSDSSGPYIDPLDHDVNIRVLNNNVSTIRGSGGPLIDVGPKQINTRHVSLNFINNGTINLDGYGIFTAGNNLVLEGVSLNNTGSIVIDGTVSTFDVSARNEFSFANSGEIHVKGNSWTRDLIHIRGQNDINVNFSNTGKIVMDGTAYSIFRIEAAQGNSEAELTNLGDIITTNKDVSYVHLGSKVTAHINTFKIPVRHGIFYAPMDFNTSGKFKVDNNTHLIFTPSEETAQETVLNIYGKYKDGIFKGEKGLLDGTLTSEMFSTNDPVWKTEFIETNPDDWTDSKVRIYYEAEEDAGQQMNVYANRLNRDRGFRFATLIDPLKVQENFNTFVRPYVSRSDYRLIDRSSVDTEGILLGFTAKLNDQFEHGIHLGYEKSDFDSNHNTQSAESKAFSLGYHALWNLNQNAYIKFIATGSLMDNDLTYKALDDQAKDSFNSWSFFGDMRFGYTFPTQSYGVFTPELGLVYTYNNMDAFDLKFEQQRAVDRHFESSGNSDFFVQPMLTWEHQIINAKGYVFKPRVSLGARALIGDTGIDAVSEFGNNRVRSSIDDERWQGVTMVKLGVYAKPFEFDLAYSGAYGQSSTSHIGWITMGYHW